MIQFEKIETKNEEIFSLMSKEMEAIKDKMRANFAEQQKFLSETAAIELTRE